MNSIGFHANGFVIIDLVPDRDMQTGRHIEENLRDCISAEGSVLFCERYRCETEHDLVGVFDRVKSRLKEKGEISYIHIEGHASKEALRLPDDSIVGWNDVFMHFREINILCKNNLFFSSGACQSAYAFKAASITEPCPVFGMLAPEQKVGAGGVLDGYIAFYKSLIINESLNDAFHAFAGVTNSTLYALIFSQLLFEKAAYKYLVQHCIGKGRKKRLESVFSQVTGSVEIPLKKARKLLKKELYGPQALNLSRFHRVFMMIDRYPENAERFEFNAVKFEKDVRDGRIKFV